MADNPTSNDAALAASTGTVQGDPSQSVQDAPAAAPQQPPSAPDAPAGPSQAAPQNPELKFDNTVTPPLPPTQQHESKWANVVKGAFAGFLQGGAPGLVEGMIAPGMVRQSLQNKIDMQKARVQEAQGRVQFANIQAAQMQAETAYRKMQIDAMPKQLQLETEKNDSEMVRFLIDHGAKPRISTPNGTPEEHQAGLESVHQTDGSVPPLLTFHTGGGTVSFDASDLVTAAAMLPQINRMRKVLGLPEMDSATFNSKIVSPQMRNKMQQDSAHFFNPADPKDLAQYQNYLAQAKQYQAAHPEDPDSDRNVQELTSAVNTLQHQQDINDQSKIKVGSAIAGSRTAGMNETKVRTLLGPDGELHDYSWDPSTKRFAVDQGISGTGQQGSRMAAAAVSYKISQDAIALIKANRDKLGTLAAWAQSKGMNTPIADPTLAKVQAVLSSVAATQPAQHSFRAMSAAEAFEKIIGGLQKNPDATIAALEGLNMTSKAINPRLGNQQTATPKAEIHYKVVNNQLVRQ